MESERGELLMSRNVFIDFDIISRSQTPDVVKEFDILIAAGKSIFLWSKRESPDFMKRYCDDIIIETPKDELELHRKIYSMRQEKKTYQDITTETGVPMKQLSYYIQRNPDLKWRLSDWIKDYYRKDSSVYSKVDFVIDPDQRVVDRFKRAGCDGNVLSKL